MDTEEVQTHEEIEEVKEETQEESTTKPRSNSVYESLTEKEHFNSAEHLLEKITEDVSTETQEVKKITICTSGSRGDVQPYVALALQLIDLGHEVKICTEERMRGLVESFNIPFHKIAGDPTAVLWEKEAQVMLRDGKIMKIMSKMKDYILPFFQQALEDYESGCQGSDIIVSGPLCLHQTYSLAEKFKVPFYTVLLAPTKSGDFPLPFIATSSLGFKWLNKLTWNFIMLMLWQNEKNLINPWRVNHLKIPPITDMTGITDKFFTAGLPAIMAINRHLIPTSTRPADWPDHFIVSGFFYVPSTPESDINPAVLKFVSDIGETPLIYLGFGSMPAPEPLVLIKRAMIVARETNAKVILCAGWSEIGQLVNPSETNLITDSNAEKSADKLDLPENLLLLSAVPHDFILPYCDVIVHHCGVGTCAAALRAGSPSVACPVMLDQPSNATRLHQLGVAPPPIPFHQLNARNLVEAIRTILKTPQMKKRAQAIASEIQKENGVLTASQFILQHSQTWNVWKTGNNNKK